MHLPSLPANCILSLLVSVVPGAIATDECDCFNEQYLPVLLSASTSTAVPGVYNVIGREDCPIVSVAVTCKASSALTRHESDTIGSRARIV